MRQPKKGFKVKMKYKSQGWRPTDMTALKGSPFPIESLHKKCIDFAFICKKGFLEGALLQINLINQHAAIKCYSMQHKRQGFQTNYHDLL